MQVQTVNIRSAVQNAISKPEKFFLQTAVPGFYLPGNCFLCHSKNKEKIYGENEQKSMGKIAEKSKNQTYFRFFSFSDLQSLRFYA